MPFPYGFAWGLSGTCLRATHRQIGKNRSLPLTLLDPDNGLDLILGYSELPSKAIDLDYPAFLSVTLYCDAPTVFEEQRVVGK
jgi:hypothetical protein